MDQVKNYGNLKFTLEKASNTNGEYIRNLLKKSMCGDQPCQTLEMMESNSDVKYEGIELLDPNKRRENVYPPLSEIRLSMITSLVSQVNKL